MDNFSNHYNKLSSYFNSRVENLFPEQGLIFDAIRYSFFSEGKRVRPVISLAVAELLGVSLSQVWPFAAAIECIHAGSLIHDDLPILDNDQFRRGKPCCHKVFGDAVALLAGDALFGLAWKLVNEQTEVPEVVRPKLNAVLSEALVALCDGQVLDLERATDPELAQSKEAFQEKLITMHQKKTGALFQAAAIGPAFYAGSEKQIEALKIFGTEFGLAFQLSDDLLDEAMECETSLTAVRVFGATETKQIAQQSIDNALISLKNFNREARFLELLCHFVLEREK